MERKNGRKGKGRGSARHGTGGQAVTEFIVLRCSYTEGRFVPPTMPRSSSLTSLGRLSSPSLPASVASTTRCPLSLSHADPLERTRFYLSLSPVNGLCRPAPRFSIVFLSLSLFRFHLLSLYNSVRKEPRVLLGVEEREKGLIVAGKIGQRTTPVSLPCRFSLFLSRVLHLTFFQRNVVACNDFMFTLIDDLVPPPREDR